MTPTAAALITFSAFAHAFWNFLGKRRLPSAAFFFMANLAAAAALSPLLYIYRDGLALIPPAVWGLVLATGVFQGIYFSGLAGAYRSGDMSLAYPLARAIPVILVALVNVLLGRAHQIGPLGYAGMLLAALGCVILPLPDFKQFRPETYRSAVGLFALVAAVGTTGYTIIDDEVLRRLRGLLSGGMETSEVTLLFMALEALSISLILGLVTLIDGRERERMRRLFPGTALYAGLTGLIIAATYGMVLLAMAYVTNVSYVAAFRQLSIPIGAILGMTLAGEPSQTPKLWGIAAVFVGLIMVGLG